MEKPQIHIKIENDQDSKAVEAILDSTAQQFSLIDNSVTSRTPNTIRSYIEKLGAGFGLGARLVEDLIVVDFNPRANSKEKFEAVFENIKSELQKKFSDRMSFATPETCINVESTLPESEAAKEFHRKMWQSLRK